MTYQLGQYVRRHNNRQNARSAFQAGALVLAGAKKAYGSFPGFARSMPSATQIIRASHEPKNSDTSLNEYPIISGASAFDLELLNGIVQGTSGTNRTGREILEEDLRLRFVFTGTAAGGSDSIRYLVVRDIESRGASFAYADLFSASTPVYSPLNMDNIAKRFQILHDSGPFRISATAATCVGVVCHDTVVKIGKKTHFYNGSNTGGAADIDTGALFLVMVSQNGVTNASVIGRLIFRDV
jgi:hypothetical protein